MFIKFLNGTEKEIANLNGANLDGANLNGTNLYRATGILERESPLFYGTGDNPTLF